MASIKHISAGLVVAPFVLFVAELIAAVDGKYNIMENIVVKILWHALADLSVPARDSIFRQAKLGRCSVISC